MGIGTRTVKPAVRRLAMLFVSLMIAVSLPADAEAAVKPAPVVHTEYVDVGPYRLQVDFSQWPLAADRALDFTFEPADGIAGYKAQLTMVPPDGGDYLHRRKKDHGLRLYTRGHDRWGLDTYSLPAQGMWRFRFTMDGPQGPGTGDLPLLVGSRPGPSLPLSWAVALAPLIAAIPLFFYLWLRGRRTKREHAWVWA